MEAKAWKSLLRRLLKEIDDGKTTPEKAKEGVLSLLYAGEITREQSEDGYEQIEKKKSKEGHMLARRYMSEGPSYTLVSQANELMSMGYTPSEAENILFGRLREKNPGKNAGELRKIAHSAVEMTGRRALPPGRATQEPKPLEGEIAAPESEPAEEHSAEINKILDDYRAGKIGYTEARSKINRLHYENKISAQTLEDAEHRLRELAGQKPDEQQQRPPPEEPDYEPEYEPASEPPPNARGTCPPEVLEVAEFLIRRMPETSFEAMQEVFLNHPTVRKYFNPKSQPERNAALSCLWDVYKEHYKIGTGRTKTVKEHRLVAKGRGFGIRTTKREIPAETSSVPYGWRGYGREAFRRGLGWRVADRGMFGGRDEDTRYKIQNNPLLRASINKGKRILQRAARAYYLQILQGADQKLNELKVRMEQAKREAKAAEDKIKDIQNKLDILGSQIDNPPPEGHGDSATAYVQGLQARYSIQEKNLQRATDAYEAAKKKADEISAETRKLEEQYEYDPRNFYNNMKAALDPIVDTQSKGLAAALSGKPGSEYWRYGGAAADAIKTELKNEADYLSRYYGKRMQRRWWRGKGKSLIIGMRNVSMGTQTFGESWTLLLHNVWNLFTGPWVTSTILVLIQFFFTLSFVGYNVQLLWVMPIATAIVTFFLNLSESPRPLDWVTHLSSGAAIGFSAMLFMIALNAQSFSFIGSTSGLGFWITWIVLSFLGIFQFYQSGGYKTVLQGSILILLFAYLALGPYQAYYHQVVDQAKAPIEIAYRAGERAVKDVWLLATNPTEWYARQQVTNVRPERPLSFPKGLELATIEALPPSVPGGQQFALATVIKHEGIIDNVTDVTLTIGCNNWCKSDFAIVSPNNNTDILSATNRFQDTQHPLSRLPGDVKDGILKSSVFYVKDELKRGEAELINVRNLVSTYIEGRQAEANFARVFFNLSYGYYTSSSLLVSVIGEAELQRRFAEGDTVFKQVTAVSKTTPAQISINVGPQPLQAGSSSLLLIGISNTRDDSKIILEPGTPITIRVPKSIVADGTNVRCDNFVGRTDPQYPDYHTVTYLMPSRAEILAYEFQSIFAFVCSFTASAGVDTVQTGLVTAEMPYRFRVEQKKDIPVTPPLGIIYEPFEATCNTCGDGIINKCDPAECYAIEGQRADDPKRTCYIDYRADNTCHVCGSTTANCDKAQDSDTCNELSARCPGWVCRWQEGIYRHPISNVDLTGRCIAVNVTTGSAASVNSYLGAYITYRDKIRAAISSNDLQNKLGSTYNAEAVVAAVITQESGWNPNAYNPNDPSYGLMAIVPGSHPTCDRASILNFDVDENINCGVGFLARLAQEHINDAPKNYNCKRVQYSGLDAIFRYYNGWPDTCTGDPDYVDKLRQHYANWVAYFESLKIGFAGSQNSNPLSDWQICSGSATNCAPRGKMLEGPTAGEFILRFSTTNADQADQDVTFLLYARKSSSSTWEQIDCSDLPGDSVTMKAGEQQGCELPGTFTEQFSFRLDSIDWANKIAVVSKL